MRLGARFWTPQREADFARDWDNEMPTEALREKYHAQHPTDVAQRLRKKGHQLKRRTGVVVAISLILLTGCTPVAWRYDCGQLIAEQRPPVRLPAWEGVRR